MFALRWRIPAGERPEFQKLIGIEDDLFRSLQPDVINNLYVSLVNDENAIVSEPYEQKIDPAASRGDPITVDFRMLQDLDAVTVSVPVRGMGPSRIGRYFCRRTLLSISLL